jgi:hypothetical protein
VRVRRAQLVNQPPEDAIEIIHGSQCRGSAPRIRLISSDTAHRAECQASFEPGERTSHVARLMQRG